MQCTTSSRCHGLPAATAVCIVLLSGSCVGSPPCSVPGWKRLEVVQTLDWSVINTTNLPLQHSFFGVEGGHMISVNNTLYTVITEFTRPPLWVPSNIALWKANLPPARNANTGGGHQSQRSRVNTGADAAQWPHAWRRVRTLFESEGTTGGTDCKSLRASLGSSASLAFDDTHNRWNIFYVGFKSCNDSLFVNRQGRIFRAVSSTAGAGWAGIEGTYTDHPSGPVLRPEDGKSQRWWEGTQGDDSMQPYSLGPGKGWASFYGSAGVLDSGGRIGQRVGLVTAPVLDGPWVRAGGDTNPVNLSSVARHIEQPMVTRLRDGSGFVAFFDALESQGNGMIGYSFSSDGREWRPECSQLLHVAPSAWSSVGVGWYSGQSSTPRAPGFGAPGAGSNVTTARTPQGAIELRRPVRGSTTPHHGASVDGADLLLGFSAYDVLLPPHAHLPSQSGGADKYHESMYLAKLRFVHTPGPPNRTTDQNETQHVAVAQRHSPATLHTSSWSRTPLGAAARTRARTPSPPPLAGCYPQFAPRHGYECNGGGGSTSRSLNTSHDGGTAEECCAYCSMNSDPRFTFCTAWSFDPARNGACTITTGSVRGSPPQKKPGAVCGYLTEKPRAPAWLDARAYETLADTRASMCHAKTGGDERHTCAYPNATHTQRDTYGSTCTDARKQPSYDRHLDLQAFCLTCAFNPGNLPAKTAVGTFCAKDGSGYMRIAYSDDRCQRPLPHGKQNSPGCATPDSKKACGVVIPVQSAVQCSVSLMCSGTEPSVHQTCHAGFGGSCDTPAPPCTGDSCHEETTGGAETMLGYYQSLWHQTIEIPTSNELHARTLN